MVEQPPGEIYSLGPDEKAVGVMFYTSSGISWGEVVVKQIIRVSTWLRTNAAPDLICLYKARSLFVSGAGSPHMISFRETYISVNEVLAYHLLPPNKEPLDFDLSEPNRRMDPVSVLIGQFKLDGTIRLSSRTTLANHLSICRETFTPLYDVEISCPIMPALSPVRIYYAQIRHQSATFCVS